MKVFRPIVLAAFFLCFGIEATILQAMAASDKPLPNATSAYVHLAIYSGLPDDPFWSLSPALTAELLGRLRALEVTNETPPVEFLGMAYVELREQDKPVGRLMIYRGFVTVDDLQGGHFRYSDPGRKLQSWLISTGHLDAVRQSVADTWLWR